MSAFAAQSLRKASDERERQRAISGIAKIRTGQKKKRPRLGDIISRMSALGEMRPNRLPSRVGLDNAAAVTNQPPKLTRWNASSARIGAAPPAANASHSRRRDGWRMM